MKFNVGNYDVDMIHHDPVIYTVTGILTEFECNAAMISIRTLKIYLFAF